MNKIPAQEPNTHRDEKQHLNSNSSWDKGTFSEVLKLPRLMFQIQWGVIPKHHADLRVKLLPPLLWKKQLLGLPETGQGDKTFGPFSGAKSCFGKGADLSYQVSNHGDIH